MSRLTASEAAEKQGRRLKESVTDIQKGVERVTEAPTLKAAAKKDKMLRNLNESVNNGKWERGLKRVSNEEWKKATIEKGIPRIAAGIDGAKDKVESFYSEFLPFLDGVAEKVNRMPDTTLEDNINRMATQAREVAKFKRTK